MLLVSKADYELAIHRILKLRRDRFILDDSRYGKVQLLIDWPWWRKLVPGWRARLSDRMQLFEDFHRQNALVGISLELKVI